MFNSEKLKLARIRHSESIRNARFYSLLIEDIIDRLEPINKLYENILVIDNNLEFSFPVFQNRFGQAANMHQWQYPNKSPGSWQKLKFDLIIFPYTLHWVTDVQQLLAYLREILKPDGILICNFAGGGSLHELRRTLIQLEMECGQPHIPHISPFIQFEHVTPLLTQAGFSETVTDMETIRLEYQSPIALMRAIQSLGQSNALSAGSGYSITKQMYKALKAYGPRKFTDTLNIITFTAAREKRSIKLKSGYFSPAI